MAGQSPDPADRAIGAALRRRRLELGQSQSDLGNVLGVSFQQIQKYERGSNRVAASTLLRAAAAQGVALSYYVEGLDGTPSQPSTKALMIRDWLGSKQGWTFAEAITELSPKARIALLQFVRDLKQ